MHSICYKDKSIFKDKRVLVVGSGETGLDLVYRAVQMTPNVVLCVKSGYLSVPYTLTETETHQGTYILLPFTNGTIGATRFISFCMSRL